MPPRRSTDPMIGDRRGKPHAPAAGVDAVASAAIGDLPAPTSTYSQSPPPTVLFTFGRFTQVQSTNLTFGTGGHSQFIPITRAGMYSDMGATVSPEEEEIEKSNSLVVDAICKVDQPDEPGPSTPTVTLESTSLRSKSCRTRVRKPRSPSPNPIRLTSASQNTWADRKWEESLWAESVQEKTSEFISYMHEFCSPIVEQMWQDRSYHMRIDYDELKSRNKLLAYFIANNFKRFRSILNAAVKEFLLDKFSVKHDDGRFAGNETLDHQITKLIRLSFTGMPTSIQSLEDFIARHPTKLVWLFDGHLKCRYQVALVSPALRRMAQKLVTYVTEAHKQGKSWNGEWVLSDWEIIDDSVVQLHKDPGHIADRTMCSRDLEAISKKVLIKLTHDGKATGRYPAFFRHLSKQLESTEATEMTDDDFFGWYYKFLPFHPALMSSKARCGLLHGFYTAAVRLDYNRLGDYAAIFADGSFGQWEEFVLRDRRTIPELLWRVFWNGKYPKQGYLRPGCMLPYNSSAGSLLIFYRQLLEHPNRYTYWKGIQMMKRTTEAELLAADRFQTFLPEFIKMLFRTDNMNGELFEYWDIYTETSGYKGE